MTDINKSRKEHIPEIIAAYEKYNKEPYTEGEPLIPAKTISNYIDKIYEYWTSKSYRDICKCKHLAVLIFEYFFQFFKGERQGTIVQFKKFLKSVKYYKDYNFKVNIFA